MLNASFFLISRNIGGAIASPAPPLPTVLVLYQALYCHVGFELSDRKDRTPLLIIDKLLLLTQSIFYCFPRPSTLEIINDLGEGLWLRYLTLSISAL